MKKLILSLILFAFLGLSVKADNPGSNTDPLCTYPVFSLQPTSATQNLCFGSTAPALVVSASPALSYQWYSNTVQTTVSGTLIVGATDSTYVPPTTTADTLYYFCVAINSGCTTISNVTGAITVGPKISVTASANPICEGQATTLTAFGASSYVWSGGLGYANTVTVVPTTTTTYPVTGTDAIGCTATGIITITVNPNPNIIINASSNPICLGESATLTATGALTYLWNTGLNIDPISVTPTVNTTYTVTCTIMGGCTGTASVTINVLPAFTISCSASPDTICPGESTTITASGASTYVWSMGLGTSNPLTVSPFVTTIYTVTGTSATGCTATCSVTVVVGTTPFVNITASANPICLGMATTLTASGATIYLWNIGSSSNPITVAPTTNTTYTVTGTGFAGCTATASVTITVNALAINCTASINPVCPREATTITWYNGSTTDSMTVTPTTTTVYTVTATSVGGCTAMDTITIFVAPVSVIAITPSTSTICFGNNVSLTATGGINYIWNTGSTFSSIIVTPTTNTTYTVTGYGTPSCSATANVTIIVDPPLNIAVGTVNASCSTCNDGTATASVSGGSPPYIYLWSSGSTTNPIIGLTPNTYTVTVVDANGCSVSLPAYVSYGSCSANFSLAPDTIPHNYNATDLSSGSLPLHYYWSWGDGTYDTIQYPSHTYSSAGFYDICLTITDATGCTNTYCDSSYLSKALISMIHVSVVPSLITGIHNYDNNSFTIHPNPANDNIIIESSQQAIIKILNLEGQLIQTIATTANKTTIDVSALAKGMYFVKVKTEKGMAVKKFVKE